MPPFPSDARLVERDHVGLNSAEVHRPTSKRKFDFTSKVYRPEMAGVGLSTPIAM